MHLRCAVLCCAACTVQVAGVEGRHVAFLMTDSHIVDEEMLGDINALLNTGEITGGSNGNQGSKSILPRGGSLSPGRS